MLQTCRIACEQFNNLFAVAGQLSGKEEKTEEEYKALISLNHLKNSLCRVISITFVVMLGTFIPGVDYGVDISFMMVSLEAVIGCFIMSKIQDDARESYAKDWYEYYKNKSVK